jgi:hypothetical protein
MTRRQRLPTRHFSESLDFECKGMAYTATYARFADGRLAEIFLGNHKTGSHADTAAKDSAVTCSIALQFGADIETLRGALLRDSSGNASGPLGCALDAIAARDAAGNDGGAS